MRSLGISRLFALTVLHAKVVLALAGPLRVSLDTSLMVFATDLAIVRSQRRLDRAAPATEQHEQDTIGAHRRLLARQKTPGSVLSFCRPSSCRARPSRRVRA